MKKKIEMALNIAVVILSLLLTIVMAIKGFTIVAVIAGSIALLNIVALILRFKTDR